MRRFFILFPYAVPVEALVIRTPSHQNEQSDLEAELAGVVEETANVAGEEEQTSGAQQVVVTAEGGFSKGSEDGLGLSSSFEEEDTDVIAEEDPLAFAEEDKKWNWTSINQHLNIHQVSSWKLL